LLYIRAKKNREEVKMNDEENMKEDMKQDIYNRDINPCYKCIVWTAWATFLPKQEQKIPHRMSEIEECEECTLRGIRSRR